MTERVRFYSVFLLGWLFVIYEYALRVSDSVILPQLQQTLGFSADKLSALSSAYYFTYVIGMIPAGVIIDRIGLYRSWLIAITTVSAGAALFASGHDLTLLIIARILMGAGSAFAIIGVFALSLSRKHSGLLVGITMAVGMAGAILGQGPFLSLTDLLGQWRLTFWVACALGLVLLIIWSLIGLALSGNALPRMECKAFRETLLILLRSKFFWIMAVFIGCLSAPQTAFMALWGPRFLSVQYQLPSESAAYVNSLISLGGLFGGILLGWVGDFFEDAKWLLFIIGRVS